MVLIYLGKNEEAIKAFDKLKEIKESQLMEVTEISPEVTQEETNQPGFEAVFAIAALLIIIAYLVLRRKRK